MSDPLERFCENVRRVFDSRDMFDVNKLTIDAIPNEMDADIDMLHFVVVVRVVRADDGALVVATQNARTILRITQLGKQRAKPNDLPRTVRARDVFGLAGG